MTFFVREKKTKKRQQSKKLILICVTVRIKGCVVLKIAQQQKK